MSPEFINSIKKAYLDSISRTGSYMSEMLGEKVNIGGGRFASIPFEQLYEGFASPETPMAVLVMRISGEGSGFLLFIMYEEAARKLNEHLWEGVPFDENTIVNLSNISALKELGNVAGTSFLNQLSKVSGLELRPSEPYVMYDMVASVLQMIIMENTPYCEEVLTIDSEFSDPALGISLKFIFLPTYEFQNMLEERIG